MLIRIFWQEQSLRVTTKKVTAHGKAIRGSTMSDADKMSAFLGFIKSRMIMEATGKTREQAMRIEEFEFEMNYSTKRIESLSYWLGSGRRDKNHRYISIAPDNPAGDMTNGVWTHFFELVEKVKQSPA
jgi:hypothetical protein